MKVIRVYLRLYADCFRKTFLAIGKNLWTLLLPMALLIAWDLVLGLVAPMGFAGGIIAALIRAALLSSYLYFVGELVQSGRVGIHEVGKSIGAYFWSLINVFFVFWLVTLVLGLGRVPVAVVAALGVAAMVALNAAPECIYLRGTYGGMQTISASWNFVKTDWIPWFAANVPLLAAVWFLLILPLPQFAGVTLGTVLAGAVLHLVMVFRGHLFRALDGTSHRQRMFLQRVT